MLWSDVLNYINGQADPNREYNISVLSNDDIGGAFTMPKAGTFGSLMISGGVFSEKTLTFTGNIVLTGETRFYNIGLESTKNGKPANFTITANYDLYATSVKSNTLTAINGTAKSSLSLYGNDNAAYPTEVKAQISGFGKVKLYGHTALTNTVKATELVLDDDSSIQILNNTVSFTNVTADGSAQIIYRNDIGDFKPMTVTGDIIGGDNSSITIAFYSGDKALRFDNNTTVLTAKMADLSKVKVSGSCVPETQGSAEFILVRVGSDVKVMPAAFKLEYYDFNAQKNAEETFALWSDMISKTNELANSKEKTAYKVTLLADAEADGALTMPKAGTFIEFSLQSENGKIYTLKFTGDITLTGSTSLDSLRLESQKKGKNGYEPANFKIKAAIKGYVGISDVYSDTLTEVNGSKGTNISFIGSTEADTPYVIDYAVNCTDIVSMGWAVEFRNTVKAGTISLAPTATVYVGESTVSAGNIQVMEGAKLVYKTKDFTPVNVTGDIIQWDDGAMFTIALADDGNIKSYQKFEPNTTVLTAKKADISKIKIADESVPEKQGSADYTLARVGSDVKIMPAAFKLIRYEAASWVEEGTYALWSDVLAKIAENAKKVTYSVEVLADTDIGGAFTMPKAGTYEQLDFYGGNDLSTIRFTGNITATGKISFNSIMLESQKNGKPANFTITTAYDMSTNHLYSETLTAINSSSKAMLDVANTEKAVTFAINKFGTVKLRGNIEFKNTVTADAFDFRYAENVYIGTASMTVKNIINADGQTIYYIANDFKPLNVTGDITLDDAPLEFALVDGNDHTSYQKFESGATVLTSKTVDLSTIKVADESTPETNGSADYTLTRVGSDVKIMPAAFKLTHIETAVVEDGTYALWSDVLAKIAEVSKTDKNKEFIYQITLLSDADIGGAFTMPKAGTYKRIDFDSYDSNIRTLKFTGNVTATGNMVLGDIKLESQKNGSSANFTITTKYDMTVFELSSDTLTAINGSTKSVIIFNSSDTELNVANYAINNFEEVRVLNGKVRFNNTVKTKNLSLDSGTFLATGKNSITTENIIVSHGAFLAYTTPDFTPVTVTGDISGGSLFIALVDGDDHISYQKFELNTTVLTAKKADISNIKLIDKSTPESSGNAEYTLARVGSDVKVMPAAFKLSHYDNGIVNDGTYALWSDVLAKIDENAKADKANKELTTYTVGLLANADINGAFTMPKAGTYRRINFDSVGDIEFTLKFTGNVTATGYMYFGDIKLESQKNGSPADFTITTKYSMSIDGLSSDTLTAINGSSTSTIDFSSGGGKVYAVDYAVNNFDKIYIYRGVRFNNTVKAKTLSLNISAALLTGKNSITVEKIIVPSTATIVYTTPDFTPVTVTGEIIAESGSLGIALFDSEYTSYQKFEPNTTVLTSKIADIAKIKVADESVPEKQGSAEYTLARVGSDVKIMPAAFKLTHYEDYDTPAVVDDGTYALWSDVLAKISEISKTNKDKGLIHIVGLLSDAEINGAFTMPKAGTYGGIQFQGYGSESDPYTLKFTGNVIATGNMYFGEIKLESQKNGSPANFTITSNYDMGVAGFSSETLTAVNGSSKAYFGVTKSTVGYAVNNFNSVLTWDTVEFKNTVKTTNLYIDFDSTVYTGKNSITTSNIIVSKDNGSLAYTTPDFTPVTVTGDISGGPLPIALVDGDDHTSYQKFAPNTTVLTSKTADIAKIKIADESVPEKQDLADHTLVRVGSDVKIMPAVFKLSHIDTAHVEDGTYALWSDVLAKIAENAKTDKGKELEYSVDLLSNADIGGAFTMPKAGTYKIIYFDSYYDTCTLKFTGNITATGDIYFGKIRLESQKNGSPANFTITTKYDMTVSELSSDTLTAINGSAKSTIVFYAPTVGTDMVYTADYAVNNFENVDIKCTVKFNNTVKNKNLIFENAALLLTGKNSITAENIIAENTWNTSNIFYTTPDFTPVTVTGEIIETLGIRLIDGDNLSSPQKFEPNTTVLTAKKADISHIEIPDAYAPGDGYTLARVGSAVKIMPAAFKLSHFDKTALDSIDDGTYALWSDVLAKIEENAKTDKTFSYTVKLLTDANVNGALTMPKAGTYSRLNLLGTNRTLTFTGNIVLTGQTYFENIKLESQKNSTNGAVPANFTITTKYDMNISELRSDTLTAVNGSSGSTIMFVASQNSYDTVNYAVRGFGTVKTDMGVEFKDTVKTKNLYLFQGSKIYTGKNSITTEKITAERDTSIVYTTSDLTPVTVTGDVVLLDDSSPLKIALVDGDDYTSYQKFDPNTTVLTAKTVDLSTIKVADESLPEKQGDEEYTLARVGSDVKIMPAAFKLLIDEGRGDYSHQGKYALWSDVLAKIDENAKTDKTLKYQIGIMADVDINGAFTMPPANTYASLIIQYGIEGSEEDPSTYPTVRFTGNISLTGTTTFKNIRLDSQKKVGNAMQSAEFSISAGRNKLELYNTNTNIKNITSNGDVLLANVTVGTLTANNVYICKMDANGTSLYAMGSSWEGKEAPTADVNITDALTVRSLLTFNAPDSSLYVSGVLSAGGIYSDNSCTLAVDKQANGRNALVIGKNGFGGSRKISFVLIDPTSGKTAEITENTVLGTVTGIYADDLVPSDLSLEEDDSYYIVKENKKLIAKSKAAAKDYVSVSINGKVARYENLDKAVKDISETGKPTDEITVYAKSSMFNAPIAKLPLPAAGKYKSITFISSATISIDLTGDLALTGDLTLKNISLRKVKASDGSILPISVNLGKYTMLMYGNSSLSADENGKDNIANLSGSGKFITGKANVGTLMIDQCNVEFDGKNASFAGNIELDSPSTLTYDRANAANIKLGSIITNHETDVLTLDIGEVNAGDTLASITGEFTANTVKINGSEFIAVRSGNKLISADAKTAVKVTDSSNNERVYDKYDSAISDINRINAKNGEYKLTLPAGEYTLTRLTLPNKGKYAKLTVTSEEEAVITVKNDIALTGDLTVGGKITLKRADGKALKITSPKDKNGSPIYKFEVEDEAVVSAVVS